MFNFLKYIKQNSVLKGLLVAAVLFLALLPLSLQINFMQNDDWVYYGMVENFLKLDFRLDPISAPTFYTQGFLGALFALIFGTERLPVLTLLVSVMCFFVFYLILVRHSGFDSLSSILLSLLMFFSPLFVYSIWGFMTENYFLLFFLLSIHFYLSLYKEWKTKTLVFYVLFLFLALNIRQVALVLPLSSFIYSLFTRNKKFLLVNLISLVLPALYLSLIFPGTAEMAEKGLQFHHFADLPYTYALLYGSFLVMTALLLPIMLPRFIVRKRVQLLLFVGLAAAAYFLSNKFYEPEKLSWGEFPYLENTFERRGFYPRGILGTKYYFRYIYDLYLYWDYVAKIVFAGFLAGLLLKIKKAGGLWLIFIIVYMGVMVVTETYYDRYLVPLLPVFILYVTGINGFGKIKKALTFAMLLFLVFFSYQFSMDFVLVNKYVWNKSEELAIKYDKEPKRVQGTNAWKLKYLNKGRNYVFDFTYDSPKVNKPYRDLYTTEEIKTIDFPGSLWVNPKIYVYKKIN